MVVAEKNRSDQNQAGPFSHSCYDRTSAAQIGFFHVVVIAELFRSAG